MQALPPKPFVHADWHRVTFGADYHVRLEGHHYSVPHDLLRQKLWARLTASTVEIFRPGKRVACHRRAAPGDTGATTLNDHRPASHRRHAETTPDQLRERAARIGPATAILIDVILRDRPHPEQGFRSCLGILRLARNYAPEPVEAACDRALAINTRTMDSVKSILINRLDGRRPNHSPLMMATRSLSREPATSRNIGLEFPSCYRPDAQGTVNVSRVLTCKAFGVLAAESGLGYTSIRMGGMMSDLPVRLEHEPLVDALFEMRMNGTPSLTDILPGFLYHALDSKPTPSRLPSADIPQVMRAADPALQFAPLIRLDWKEYLISVGDRNVVISCKMPYPKWPSFKATILELTRQIGNFGLAGNVERYSLKYVNLVQAPTLAEQIAKIKIAITLGEVSVADDHATLQVHRHENGILHILSVIIGAEGQLADGRRLFGAVVDIDSIRTIEATNVRDFADRLEPGLEELRQANKQKFFSCLTDGTIEEMGPVFVPSV